MRITANSSLQDWYIETNSIYYDRNTERHEFAVYAHLAEVVSGLSILSSGKVKEGVTPGGHFPKAFAWWLALCGKFGVCNVEDMLWNKFPGVCPYCRRSPHNQEACDRAKFDRSNPGRKRPPDWDALKDIARHSRDRPRTFIEWQRKFNEIFPASESEGFVVPMARLNEEVGELAEAVRAFRYAPGYFFCEAPDVFAWLMKLLNVYQLESNRKPHIYPPISLGDAFESTYAGRCPACDQRVCRCPTVLPSTLGRIAGEIPAPQGGRYHEGGALLSPEQAHELFALSARELSLGGRRIEVTAEIIRELHSGMRKLMEDALRNSAMLKDHSSELFSATLAIRDLTESQRINNEAINRLAATIAGMSNEQRQVVLSWITNVFSGPVSNLISAGVAALIQGRLP